MKTSRYAMDGSDSDDYSSVFSSSPMDHEQQQNDGDDANSAGPEALRRLQRKLTAAMEHMERAQLEFFHVERTFEDHKQQQQQEQEDKKASQLLGDQNVPWSLKVQLYCEFWQQFVVQLRSAIRGGGDGGDDCGDDEGNEQAIQALSVLASNVWGETRAFPQEIFRNGPIVLSPRPKQRESRVPTQQEKRSAAAFSGLGSYQDASRWIPTTANPPLLSLRSLMANPVAAQSKSATITAMAKVSSNGKVAAHDAVRPRKKVKRVASKESGAAAGNGAYDKTTAGGSVNGAKQRVASSASVPGNDFQFIAAKSRSAAASSSASASESVKAAPVKMRHASPNARKRTGTIGFLDRLLADRGHSPTAADQEVSTGDNSTASAPRPHHQLKKKKKLKAKTSLAARKHVLAGLEEDDDDDDDQAFLQIVPIPETTSDFSEAIVQVKQEVTANGRGSGARGLEKKIRGASRYAFFERLRERIQDLLGANEPFPNIAIPFPSEHLVFDPDERPLLAEAHEHFWETHLSAYLEIVFYHPAAEDLNRLRQNKMRMLRLQRALLGRYVETLGIHTVASKLQAKEASIPFFFVKSIIMLNSLSSQDLDEHIACLRAPWKSPTTQSRVVSWWEALVCRKNGSSTKQHHGNSVKQHLVVDISDTVKQQITSAHFRGELDFDADWLRLSTQPPWKEMLDEQRSMRVVASPATTLSDDDEHEHGLPQSPPHRKKVAGKVSMNRESMRASSESAERVTWLQQLASRKVNQSHAESSSGGSSSEDDDDEANGDFGAKLGKRLRTNKG